MKKVLFVILIVLTASSNASRTIHLKPNELFLSGITEIDSSTRNFSLQVTKDPKSNLLTKFNFVFDRIQFELPNISNTLVLDLKTIQILFNGGITIGENIIPNTISIEIPNGELVDCGDESILDYDTKYKIYNFTLDSKLHSIEEIEACIN